MRTIIIENDLAFMNTIEESLKKIELTNIIGKYTCVSEAEAQIMKLRPELIILEMDLIKVDGLTFAKRIEQEMRDIKFVFITSNSIHAVGVFELNQADFILKPINQERFEKALYKLSANTLKINQYETHFLCCFKHLHYIKMYDDYTFEEIGLEWRTKDAKEIFTYLINYKNINIKKETLIDIIWPNLNIKEAYNNLYTNIYNIRKTIEAANLPITIKNNNDSYNINLNGVQLDFEFWLGKIRKYKPVSLSRLENAMIFYKDHFLQEEGYLWAEPIKEKYRIVWLETIEYIIEEDVRNNKVYQAIMNALYFQKLEPYLEKTYYILIDLFNMIKDSGSAERQYEKLNEMINEE